MFIYRFTYKLSLKSAASSPILRYVFYVYQNLLSQKARGWDVCAEPNVLWQAADAAALYTFLFGLRASLGRFLNPFRRVHPVTRN